MTQIDFHIAGWRNHGGGYTRGHAFDETGRPVDLQRCVRDVTSFHEFQEIMRDLSGFFAVIVDRGSECFLACDHARTVPIYFTTTAPLEISDTAARIGTLAEETGFDPVAESEFLLTRYVTGGETLSPQLASVGAGEAVRVPTDRPGSFERARYYDYRPTSAVSGEHTATQARLLDALETALDRTVRYLGDRPAVVPLSGGLDSRVVASSLAQRGVDVTAFTFGRRGHADVEVSRAVADNLGIDWEWVEYTPDRWVDWYHSAAYRDYCAWAFNFDSLPFLANWPAVKVLCEEERIPPNAVVCPGHTVATPSERVPEGWLEQAPSRSTVIDHILDRHYALWDWDDARARDIFESRIATQTDLDSLDRRGDMAAAYEQWEWATRMAIFTHGDLRIYDWFDFDWWLPLWDPAYVAAWAETPLELRLGKRLQNDIARERYAAAADVPPAQAGLTDTDWGPLEQLRRTIETDPQAVFASDFDDWFGAQSTPRSGWEEPGNHPLGWYGILPEYAKSTGAAANDLYAIRTLVATGRYSLDPSEHARDPIPRRLDLPLSAAGGGIDGRL